MIVTDDLTMPVRAGLDYESVVKKALLAGNDHLFIVTIDEEQMNKALNIAYDLIDSGEISLEDLDQRILRIFAQKNMLIRNMYKRVPSNLVY